MAETPDTPGVGPAFARPAAPGRLTREAMAAFLAALAETGQVDEALRRSGAPRAALYRKRDRRPLFAAQWDRALAAGLDALRDAAVRRALEGVERPLTWRGEIVGTARTYPDQLLAFLLRTYQPQAGSTARTPGPAALARAEKAQAAALQKAFEEGGAAALDTLLREIDGTTRGIPAQRGERA